LVESSREAGIGRPALAGSPAQEKRKAKIIYGKRRKINNYTGMHRLQKPQLQHDEKQDKTFGKSRIQKILQILF
jgi:hypothetical protein